MMDDLSEVTGSELATNQLKYLDLQRLMQPAQDKQKGICKVTIRHHVGGFKAFPRVKSENFNNTPFFITQSSPDGPGNPGRLEQVIKQSVLDRSPGPIVRGSKLSRP
jgi:hypothetical protein